MCVCERERERERSRGGGRVCLREKERYIFLTHVIALFPFSLMPTQPTYGYLGKILVS